MTLNRIADIGWAGALYLSCLSAGAVSIWMKKADRGVIRLLSVFFLYGAAGFLAGGAIGGAQYKKIQDYRQARAEGGVLWAVEGKTAAEGIICQMGKSSSGKKALLKNVSFPEYPKVRLYFSKMPVYMDEETAEGLEPGMKITVFGKVSWMEPASNPGEFDYQSYALAENMSCQMFAEKVEITDKSSSFFFLPYLFRIGRWIEKRIETVYDGEDRGIIKAVLLGEKSDLSGEIKELYQKNGIAHLLAISGLHISVIAAGFYGLLRKWGADRIKASALSVCFAASYGVMTGASSSAVRAVFMFSCTCLAACLGRTYDILSSVSLVMVLLLAAKPLLLFQAGFQLSFGAIFGIGLIGQQLILWTGAEKTWQKTICVSLGIQLATCPVILYHYFTYPPYGFLLNFIVIPLMTWVMVSGLAAVFLSALYLPAGMMAAGSGHYILEFYSWICSMVSRLPASELVMGRPSSFRLYLYYGSLCLFLFLISKRTGEKNGTVGRLAAAGAVFVTLMMVLPASMSKLALFSSGRRGLTVTCLDTGQGDGAVIETGKQAVLIDGGSTDKKNLGRDSLEPFLKSKGIGTVSCAIVSHGDNDHISGILYLLNQNVIPIRLLILPAGGREQEIYQQLEELQRKNGGQVVYMKEGMTIKIGEADLTCLYDGMDHSQKDSDRNAHSLILRLSYGKFSMIFTGDADWQGEKLLLEKGKDIQSAVLKAGHHGSDTSNSREFLQAVSPHTAVLSYGKGNSYGHPSKQVVERLKDLNINIEETAQNGAIIIETDGTSMKLSEFLQKK